MVSGGFVVIASAILFLSALSMWRLAVGRTIYDRLLAAGVVGTNIVGLLVVLGFVFERPDMFVDLALTYALLNFIGTVAASRYLARHPEEGA